MPSLRRRAWLRKDPRNPSLKWFATSSLPTGILWLKDRVEKRLPNVRINSILREEVQTALNKRTGCGLNASFNSEQYGSEELLRERSANGSCF
jgi:hypothetical protein